MWSLKRGLFFILIFFIIDTQGIGKSIPLSIGEIRDNPAYYQGKTVVIKGKFLGWNAPQCNHPKITRSDWAIEDETGCIYVTGIWPDRLDPVKHRGRRLIVDGKIEINEEGIPYIRAISIKVISSRTIKKEV